MHVFVFAAAETFSVLPETDVRAPTNRYAITMQRWDSDATDNIHWPTTSREPFRTHHGTGWHSTFYCYML